MDGENIREAIHMVNRIKMEIAQKPSPFLMSMGMIGMGIGQQSQA